MELDRTDRKILELIQQDASMSAAEIAEQVNLSQPPCWRRIKRLEEQGYIQKRTGILDREKLGLNMVIYTEVKLSANGRQAVNEFQQHIQSLPEVTECYLMMGRIDFLLRIVTRDVASYEQFYRDHLSHIPDIQELNSTVAMSEVKYTTELPLHLV